MYRALSECANRWDRQLAHLSSHQPYGIGARPCYLTDEGIGALGAYGPSPRLLSY